MQLRVIVYRHSILNVLELNYRAFYINFNFLRKSKVVSCLMYVFAIYRLQFSLDYH